MFSTDRYPCGFVVAQALAKEKYLSLPENKSQKYFTKPVEHSLQQVYNPYEKIMKEEKPMTKQGKEMDMLHGGLAGKLILFAFLLI